MKRIFWKILAIFVVTAILQIVMAILEVEPQNREALSFAVGGALGYALGSYTERNKKEKAIDESK